MNIFDIGRKIIIDTMDLPLEIRPTDDDIRVMVAFLNKLQTIYYQSTDKEDSNEV